MPCKYGTLSNIAPHPFLVYHSTGEKGWDYAFFRVYERNIGTRKIKIEKHEKNTGGTGALPNSKR